MPIQLKTKEDIADYGEYLKSKGNDASDVDDYVQQLMSQLPQEAPSKLESAIRGAGQGLSLGFEDEIRAAAMAPFSEKTYGQLRDEIRKLNERAQQENPLSYGAGELGGGVATTFIPGLGLAGSTRLLPAAAKAAALGGATGYGFSEKEGAEALGDIGTGAVAGGALGTLGKAVEKPLSMAAQSLAKRATGATGTQVMKFRPEAGKELLNMGLVKFYDSPKTINRKISKEMNRAGREIGNSLKPLQTKFNIGDVESTLQKSINEMEGATQKAEARNVTSKFLENLKEEYKDGIIPIQKLELEKRKYGEVLKNAWADPDKAPGKKNVYETLMNMVEKGAESENPGLAQKFAKEKKIFGLLAPIEEASAKRAAQLQQRVFGGLLDLGAFGVGSGGFDITDPKKIGKGLGLAAARHTLGPRAASSLAKTAEKLGIISPRAIGTLPALLDFSKK